MIIRIFTFTVVVLIFFNKHVLASISSLPFPDLIHTNSNKTIKTLPTTAINVKNGASTSTSTSLPELLSSSYQIDSFINNKSYQNPPKQITGEGLPHLVIHVGPPKTATTTIQVYLTKWYKDKILEEYSGYLYLGTYDSQEEGRVTSKLFDLITDFRCHEDMKNVREAYEKNNDFNKNKRLRQLSPQAHMSLSEAILSNVSCASMLVSEIQKLSKNKTNLLLFEELLSSAHFYYHAAHQGYRYFYGPNNYPTIFDWISLHSILQDYYQITVVLTYRRFYQWLPSAKSQYEKYYTSKYRLNLWPNYNDNSSNLINDIMMITRGTTNITTNKEENNNTILLDHLISNVRQNLEMKSNGTNIEPMFPSWWKKNFPPGSTEDMPHYFMDSIIRGIDQVNHRQNNNSVSTILSETPIIRLILLNMYSSRSDSSSSSSISQLRSLFICSLPDAAELCHYSRDLDIEEERKGGGLHQNHGGTNWYDELVINAARYGFLNITKYLNSRQHIVKLATNYHKSLLTSQSLEINYEFPLLCPSVNELTEFLNQSLKYEELILPDYYNINKDDHMKQFWDSVNNEKKHYCSIDIISILREPYWQHFFIELVPLELTNET